MHASKLSVENRDFCLGLASFSYADLYEPARLEALAERFYEALGAADPALGEAFARYRGGEPLAAVAESDLLVRVGRHLGPFVAHLFGIEGPWGTHGEAIRRELVIFDFKREFISKRLRKRKGAPQVPPPGAYEAIEAKLGGAGDDELRAARCAMALLRLFGVADRRPAPSAEELRAVADETAVLVGHPVAAEEAKATLHDLLDIVERYHASRQAHVDWVSYHFPHPIDTTGQNLVRLHRPRPGELPEAAEGPTETFRRRDGFALTDARMSLRQVSDQVDYCMYCHEREKDSCRKGLHDKAGGVRKDALGTDLHGCPLDERISEMHVLRRAGDSIAALAMVVVDNPMCPGTGHRICNDCMKACIFQKQEPVNIPQIETGVLTDVLKLPFGFEIYALLTRWNPLNRRRPFPRAYHGHNALVVGLGPAGYTLAHYLVNEGFGVVGVDGLKIEPLPDDLVGADVWPPRAVRDYTEIEEGLDDRVARGFGGVAEYGITVRWDKNFLKVIFLSLARRRTFRCFGGIRFGGTFNLEDAWAMGFHHVGIAAGAGKPTVVAMKNNLLRGMRAASDFLMGLQLSGAFRRQSLANLQVELPAVVIGGGLTAVDTATELAAYYPVQVEKVLERVEALGEAEVMAAYDAEEREIVGRMLSHGRELREERKKPRPDIPGLVRRWGGVSLAYRRSLVDSPAYRLNHEEVAKALEEGITFIENLTPTEALADRYGHIEALKCRRADGSEVTLPARAVMVAAGTTPNTIYEKEMPGSFALDERGKFFKAHRLEWRNGQDPRIVAAAPGETGGFFTSYQGPNRRCVSYYGDNHPRYAGNVVKAMASAKHGYPHVARLFADQPPAGTLDDWGRFTARLEAAWSARVERVERLTPTIVEVVVHAPMQARKFKPGQFYRLQNFEACGPRAGGASLAMEGLALTGAWVDPERGLLSMIALEMGTSSRLCALLKPGEPVVVMGPTGTPTEIPEGETVVLCGGGLGNAVLFSVAKAMRAAGNKVIYFAGYRRGGDMYKREEVEGSCDQVIWSVDVGDPIVPGRPQDRSFVGNIVEAMRAYADGHIPNPLVRFSEVDRIIAIGSDRMMAAVTRARKTVLAPHLKPDHEAIASINSPMQCMMKEVCAQCLQRHLDPVTGEESFVFSCFNQDQRQDVMDWTHLAARLRQNTVLEKLSNLWLDRLMPRSSAS
jgi:NADPH-dependent glutamate synthase beta subunit-like oxidoreductase/NAD(P)H-flavin reductase